LYGVPDSKTLNLTLFLEGLYSGGGTMNQAQDVTGPRFGSGIADQITVELHNAVNYNTIEYSATAVNLGIDGHATVTIPGTYNGSYYITIKHRNSIETTTSTAISFTGVSISYNFDVASKAYGNNLNPVYGKYCIYAGDVNQDGIVDGSDLSPVLNGSQPPGLFGYIPEDVNGDGTLDGGDMSMIYNNSQPPAAQAKKP
jgi:hypothetical protein